MLIGLILTIVMYAFNFPYYIGLILILLSLIFLLSNHRGFTHSIFGIIVLSILISAIVICGMNFIIYFSMFSKYITFKLALVLMIILLSVFVLNKRVLPFFLALLILCLLFIPCTKISYVLIFISLILGFLSHLILDSFSSSGIRLFRPFSNQKVYKKFGIILSILLIILSIPHLINLSNLLF